MQLEEFATKIPFRLLHNVIALPVRVNRKGPYTFVLDTGAGKTILLPWVATELGLRLTPLPFETAMGAGGEVAVSIADVEELSLSDVKVHDFQVAILDLSAIEAKVGERLGGVLGSDFLARFEVTINYRETWLRLRSLPQVMEVKPPI